MLHRAGPYTVRLLVGPKFPGSNKVRITFVDAQGLPAGDVTTIDLVVERAGHNPRLLAMGWTGPGQFAGDTDLVTPGLYRLLVRTMLSTSRTSVSTTFTIQLQSSPAS
jgi:hypothetical protein